VRFETVLGDFEVLLCAEDAPATVANFLDYVDDGDYASSLVHRRGIAHPDPDPRPDSPPVIQGGGFALADNAISPIPTEAPIALEAGLSNLRGTLAMARAADPNSATSQWYLNLEDNVGLDPFPPFFPGFAVFGEVTSGLDVVDAIGALTVCDFRFLLGGDFGELPLRDFPSDCLAPLTAANLVLVERVTLVPAPRGAPAGGAALAALAALAHPRRRTTTGGGGGPTASGAGGAPLSATAPSQPGDGRTPGLGHSCEAR
jgi:cyclophilin family peptidyl-prolyl cis-trans isomerase